MNHFRGEYNEAASIAEKAVHFALQPLILAGAMGYWLQDPGSLTAFPLILLTVHLILGSLERLMPARPSWLISGKAMAGNALMVLLLSTGAALVAGMYAQLLAEPLAQLRLSLHLDVWPHHWPLLVQALMVFFLSELIWYGFHRAEHRWYPVWRLSGHGAHHSFKNLGALNYGLNHPLELFLLVLPAALIELTFGVGAAAAGAVILTTTQASLAHANLDLNARGIGWLLTTNRYHIHHHSVVMAESNTNYGCAAIVWDRLFGTFADSHTEEAGIGAREPGLLEKLLMPVREPVGSAIAPKRR